MGQARASSVACQSLSGVTSRGVTGRIFVATVSRGLAPKIRRFIQRLDAESHEADSSGKVQFPIKLAENLIKTFSRPKDIVIDPFAGSGNMILAALCSDRDGIEINIEAAYVELAQSKGIYSPS